jgi:hypothetical protein
MAGLDAAEATTLAAHVALAKSRVAADRARATLERTAARRGGTHAEIGVARAVRRSAEAHSDDDAAGSAARGLSDALEASDVLNLLIRWRRAEVRSADATQVEALAAVWSAQAELELKKAILVTAPDTGVTAFVRQAERLGHAQTAAKRVAHDRAADAERHRLVWRDARSGSPSAHTAAP